MTMESRSRESEKLVPPREIDPVIEAYKKDIDRSLLRENLRRSVSERLANLAALLRFAENIP